MFSKLVFHVLLGVALFVPVIASADEGGAADIPALMDEKRCDVCHHRAARRSGPPYRMIADLHAGKEGIVNRLAKKIIKGGMGTWGATPMPPNSHVSEEEARAMAEWIMQQQ